MALVINTNVQSLNSQRQLNKSSMETSQAMERLSSGKQINSAKDDAAGLVISNRMTSQIRGLDRAVANANDGVSLIQTAEGAMEETTNILQRMRELSIQSANGIYNDGDRATLDAEVQQLVSELDRIAETTSFNGQNLLDGSLGEVKLQVGSEANQTIGLNIEAMNAQTLGMGSTSVDLLGAASALASLTGAEELGYNDVLINGQSILASDETFDGAAEDVDALLEKINTNVNGITASTVATAEFTTTGDGVLTAAEEITVTVVNNDGTSTAIDIRDTESMDEVVSAINASGSGLVSASLNDDGELVVSAQDASSITVADGSTGNTALGAASVAANAQIVLTADNDDPVTVERGSNGTFTDLHSLGFLENSEPGTVEGVGLSAAGTAWGVGDVSINGVSIASDVSAPSLQAKINNINDVSAETGVTASAFVTAELDMSSAVIVAGAFSLNGVDITVGGTAITDVVTGINAQTNSTGITATLSGTNIQLEGSASSISFDDEIGSTGTIAATFTTAPNVNTMVADGTEASTALAAAVTVDGGLKLTSSNGNPISIEIGDNATANNVGLVESNVTSTGAFGSSVSTISIATQAGAQKAIEIIDNAINSVSSNRADLGAVNNRLDFTISNLSNISEKTSSARSSIVDADFAAETANLSRAQVLQQASQAMLAQANAAPQQVLSLLR